MTQNWSTGLGCWPFEIATVAKQCDHSYQQFLAQPSALQQNRYLRNLLDANETVFYALVQHHLKEMLPIIYTPTVGEAVQQFSQTFLQPRGLFISWPNREQLDQILESYARMPIDIAVITDGERILGLGDQGVGGIEICIAKALLYVLGAQLSPRRLLPIYLDVGTDNPELLNDPHYLGWRHERIKGKAYDDFIEAVVSGLKQHFPKIYIHWEDFTRDNARQLLARYQTQLCVFNDDMQGTGVVTLAAALAAVEAAGSNLKEQRIVIFGAGAAGTGIADQLCDAMQRQGLSREAAQRCIWMLNSKGLVMLDSPGLSDFHKPYARPAIERASYFETSVAKPIQLLSVVERVKPTFLIGCSGQGGTFTEAIIKTMASAVQRPIIFPLSNPTEKSEATPQDLVRWTAGRALIATGSPFSDVAFQGQLFATTQCNNALVFPGIGLGIKASGAQRLTDNMLWAACLALGDAAPVKSSQVGGLLPDINQMQAVTQKIAKAVVKAAITDGVTESDRLDVAQAIQSQLWKPGL